MALGRNPLERIKEGKVTKATDEFFSSDVGKKKRTKHFVTEDILEDYKRRFEEALRKIEELSKQKRKEGITFEDVSSVIKRVFEGVTFPFKPSSYSKIIRGIQRLLYSDAVDIFGYDPKFEEFITPIFEFLYKKWWRVSLEGVENVPSEGPVILVSNHSGTLPVDGAMIKAGLLFEHPQKRDARPLAENFVYYLPFIGTIMNRVGGVRACPENAEMLLERGDVVMVFPEGVKGIVKPFKYRYKLQRFGRGGFVRLAMKTRSKMVPVAVVGAEEVYPIIYKIDFLGKIFNIPTFPITLNMLLLGPLGWIPFPSKWYIKFGKPMDFSEFPPDAYNDDIIVNQISQMVRSTIQDMLIEMLRKRRSIWFG